VQIAVRKPRHRAPPSDRTDRSVPPLYFCLRTLSRRRTRNISFRRDTPLSRVLCHCAVRLPESFRGGCSFGAGSGPVSPAAMRTLNHHLLCTEAQGSTAPQPNCHPLFRRMWTSNHLRPLRGQKESVGTETAQPNENKRRRTLQKSPTIQRAPASDHRSGRGGRRFKSCHSDQTKTKT
jgi:hypothetical protein